MLATFTESRYASASTASSTLDVAVGDLVVFVTYSGNDNNWPGISAAPTDTGGHTWTLIGKTSATNGTSHAICAAYQATITTAGKIVVTANASSSRELACVAYRFLAGQHDGIGNSVVDTGTSGVAPSETITTTSVGSFLVGAYCDWNTCRGPIQWRTVPGTRVPRFDWLGANARYLAWTVESIAPAQSVTDGTTGPTSFEPGDASLVLAACLIVEVKRKQGYSPRPTPITARRRRP